MSQVKKESVLHKKYSPAQLKEDATLLKNVVLAMHPVIGIYNTRTYYENLFTNFITAAATRSIFIATEAGMSGRHLWIRRQRDSRCWLTMEPM